MKKNKSMLESAYEIVSKSEGAKSFNEIFAEVKADLEMTDEEGAPLLGEFYTALTLDGRFVTLTDNTWDLRSRHTYEKVHIDVDEVYSSVNESDGDEVTEAEEAEYNAEISGKSIDEDTGASEDEDETDRPKDDSYFN